MGILDSTFAGKSGLAAILHETLGGTATVRIASFRKDESSGEVERFYASYSVPFVPSSNAARKVDLSAPNASRSDIRERNLTLAGTIPVASLGAEPRPERDLIVFQGAEYLITAVELLSVGDAPVQYSITAERA